MRSSRTYQGSRPSTLPRPESSITGRLPAPLPGCDGYLGHLFGKQALQDQLTLLLAKNQEMSIQSKYIAMISGRGNPIESEKEKLNSCLVFSSK